MIVYFSLLYVCNFYVYKNSCYKGFKNQPRLGPYLMPDGFLKFEEFLEMMDVEYGRILMLIKYVIVINNPTK